MTALTIIACAIFLDLFFNEGSGLSSVFKAIGSIFHPNNTKIGEIEITKSEQSELIEAIENLKTEIDNLIDDLTYDNNEKETESIKRRLQVREDLLQSYLIKLNNLKEKP
jgi:predicted AAA+ superfamily ATPase